MEGFVKSEVSEKANSKSNQSASVFSNYSADQSE